MYNKLLKTTLRLALMSAIFAASMLPQTVTAQDQTEVPAKTVYYVKENATGEGKSWDDASGDLQKVINDAKEGDEVWVWKGTYKPQYTAAGWKAASPSTEDGKRNNAFVLKEGVKIYGGFTSEVTGSVPDFGIEYRGGISTLSGDIDEGDDDAYHVVIGAGISADVETVLDGFTISGGNANGSGNISVNNKSIPSNGGGGIACVSSSPILTNLIISGNKATTKGGGIFNDVSSPTLTDVTISKNEATTNGGGIYNDGSSAPKLKNVTISENKAKEGGGIYNMGSSPTLTDVIISENKATGGTNTNGGGIYNNSSAPKLENVTISGNEAAGSGGGIFNYKSSPELKSVIISGNAAGTNGGGICNSDVTTSKLENVTISGNKATDGGGMYNASNNSNPALTKTIVWGNSTPNVSGSRNATPTYKSSMVVGVTEAPSEDGGGDDANYASDTDPQFVSPISAENAPTTGGDYHLWTGSPLIKEGQSLGAYGTFEAYYGITISQEKVYTFADATFGYENQTPLTVTVKNTGNTPTGKLSIALSDATGFIITKNSWLTTGITGNRGEETFNVVPKKDLNVGTYTTTVTISNSNVAQSFDVSFTVNKATPTTADLNYSLTAVDYNGKPQPLTVTAKKPGLGTITVMYGSSTDAPTNAGTYKITVDIATGSNYTNNRQSVMSLGDYTINKIEPKVTDIAYDLHDVVGNGSPQSVTVKAAEGIVGFGDIKIFYNGSETLPVDPGEYYITFTIDEGINYLATSTWWFTSPFTIYKPQTIQHRVTILPSSGLETFPSFGSYNINAGANFTFRIKLDAPSSTGALPQVQTDRTGTRTDGPADFLITPDADGLNYTVVIFAVNQDIVISLDAPTGNAAVADALTLGTVPGALVITNSRSDAVTLQVYTPAGTPVRLTTVPPGTTRLTVPPGIYIVTDGGAFRRKTAVVQ